MEIAYRPENEKERVKSIEAVLSTICLASEVSSKQAQEDAVESLMDSLADIQSSLENILGTLEEAEAEAEAMEKYGKSLSELTLDEKNDVMWDSDAGFEEYLYKLEKEGKIVNITSMWGQVGASMEVHYSASKAGLIGMTKALAKEVGLSGITVNAVSPGVIKTDMISEFSEDEMQEIINEIPLGRTGSPEEIAQSALFFASENASYITGQVLSPGGGIVI